MELRYPALPLRNFNTQKKRERIENSDIEAATAAQFPVTGESNKIYVALDTNLTYRWGGSAYVEISPSLALGNTHSTAFYGDYGETAYSHSQLVGAQGQARNPHNVILSDLGYAEATSQEIAAIFS